MVWIQFSQTVSAPELDASIDEVDAIPSSISSNFRCSVNTVSNNSSLQLASNLTNYGSRLRALLFPVLQAGKMSASRLIHYISDEPMAFGFWASLPPGNIILNTNNKRIYQNLLYF